MATTDSTPRTGSAQAVRPGVVVLVDARSATERALIARWAADAHPRAELVDHDPAPLDRRLRLGGDPLIVPARVTWLPHSRDGDATGSMLGDLRALSARRPPAMLQPAVLRRAPGRATVTAGEPEIGRAHV